MNGIDYGNLIKKKTFDEIRLSGKKENNNIKQGFPKLL